MVHCEVPEKFHTHPKGMSLEILRGWGVVQVKNLEAKYEAKLVFLEGRGMQNKNLLWGSVDIFWDVLTSAFYIASRDLSSVVFSEPMGTR